MFLNSFNYFRFYAISMVVAGHVLFYSNIRFDTILERVVGNIILGGTSLFLFISGFLFHHIFFVKFNYIKFTKSKFLRVVSPYLFLSMPYMIYMVTERKDIQNGFFMPIGSGWVHEYLIPAVKYALTGAHVVGYWYIPFIFLIFIIQPAFNLILNLSVRNQLVVIAVLSIVSICVHRSIDNFNVLHNVLYFSPVYLVGMVCSQHRNFIYTKLGGYELLFFFLIIAFAFFQAVNSSNVGSYHKDFFVYGGVDLIFIQKIFSCIFAMQIFHRFEGKEWRVPNKIAEASFAIFFIHPYVLRVFGKAISNLEINVGWLGFVVLFSIVMLSSLFIAMVIKNILKEKSKYIIGW